MTAADRLRSLNGDHLESICPELAAVVEAAESARDHYAAQEKADPANATLAAGMLGGPLIDALDALDAKLGAE